MDKKFKDQIRAQFTAQFMEYARTINDDIGQITSGSFNIPVVAEDGSEGWVEVVIKVPNDEGDDGYDKRQEYEMHCAEQAAKKAEAAAKKAAKIAADKAKRAAKEKEEG